MLRKILYLIGLICAGIAMTLLYLINTVINRPNFVSPGQLSDTDYKEFTATTRDGISIHAVFYEGAVNADTVLLCHGHGVNLNYMNDMVKFLRIAGYNLVLLDFRAHGRSGGTLCPIGLLEWQDIKAVLTKARELGFLKPDTVIAAYGRSMGAASLINGAAELPEIKAFVLESSFARLRLVAANDAYHTVMLPDTPLSDFAFWLISIITSTDFAGNQPVEQGKNLADRAVFLIHDELDWRADLKQFEMLKKSIPNATTWVSPDSWHVCAHKKNPAEFEGRFLDFLYKAGVVGHR
ncbi:MAG: alpha/beta hydrolase [Candidatus Riflebacteria bacterium]|nr:alpha/beta hydrolase [Candidatus Riflebacteria bacterium]